LHLSRLIAHYAGLNAHCNTYQTRAPLAYHYSTDMRVCLGNERLPWERASLVVWLGPVESSYSFVAHGP
jgi:hypothetical protein